MWPVHTWLPDAHVEAPTGGSVVLAAIMLKLGAYGFLRFSLPIAPDASREWAWFIIALSLIAVIYIGLVALVQQDMKKLVAYSSIAHMGFVHAGLLHLQRARRVRRHRADDLATASSRARCSCASACSTTACTRARSRPTAAWSTRCPSSPRCARAVRDGQLRPAGHQRLRRRVDGDPRHRQGQLLARRCWPPPTLIFGAAYTLWMVKRVYFGAGRQRPRARR